MKVIQRQEEDIFNTEKGSGVSWGRRENKKKEKHPTHRLLGS